MSWFGSCQSGLMSNPTCRWNHSCDKETSKPDPPSRQLFPWRDRFAVAGGRRWAHNPPMTRKSLSDAILAHLRAHPSQPMTKSDLARQLKVPSDQRGELRKAIEGLVRAGHIQEGKKSCYLLRAKTGNSLVGTLKFHPKGHAFFFPDATDESNLATGIDLATNSRIHVARRDCGTRW